MNLLIGKLLIFLCCAAIQLSVFPLNATYIIVILVAFILCNLDYIFQITDEASRKKLLTYDIILAGCLLCALLEPMCICFFPIVFFDITHHKLNISGGINIILLIYAISFFPLAQLSILAFLCMLSIYIQMQSSKLAALEIKILHLRDSSKEHELLIQEKNKNLRENQDNQIYMATLRERNRIAREIHDNVGHMLTRSILQVGAIKTLNTTETIRQPLEDLHSTLNNAMTGIRNSVHDLHDESIDLKQALTELIEPVEQFSIRLDYDMGHHIPKDIKYGFITITKEAINNAIKHSNASSMDILLREHPGFFQLLIHDNGSSISEEIKQDPYQSEGIGLKNISDRVNTLNGNLKINTDNGFQITVSVMKNKHS